jgi:hypothetical protein
MATAAYLPPAGRCPAELAAIERRSRDSLHTFGHLLPNFSQKRTRSRTKSTISDPCSGSPTALPASFCVCGDEISRCCSPEIASTMSAHHASRIGPARLVFGAGRTRPNKQARADRDRPRCRDPSRLVRPRKRAHTATLPGTLSLPSFSASRQLARKTLRRRRAPRVGTSASD